MMKDKKQLAERILNHALGIIYLMTGEEYVIVKKNSPHSSIHLLSGEVPIKCGDISVYFSMEEWDYIEGHKDIYKDVVIEDRVSHHPTDIPENTAPETPSEKIETISISEEGDDESDEEDIQVVEIDPDACAADLLTENGGPGSNHADKDGQVDKDVSDAEIIPDVCRADGSLTGTMLDGSRMAEEEDITHSGDFRESYGGVSPIQSSLQEIRDLPSPYRSYDRNAETQALSERGVTRGGLEVSLQSTQTSSNCGKVFHGLPAYSHLQMLARGQTYACNVCGKVFDYKSNLIRHQKVHAVGKPPNYAESSRLSGNKAYLSVRQRGGNIRKRHRCNECGKQFTYKSQFTTHLRTHTGEKPHSCNECGKHFAYKSYLITHQRIHSGERPHVCVHCGRCFTDKSNLRKHQTTHGQDRPYTCLECGKHFNSKYNFSAHQRLHTERATQSDQAL
ncbi:oocyte zinc finger protein XlCOF8.4-like [Pelodytes ibericus]